MTKENSKAKQKPEFCYNSNTKKLDDQAKWGLGQNYRVMRIMTWDDYLHAKPEIRHLSSFEIVSSYPNFDDLFDLEDIDVTYVHELINTIDELKQEYDIENTSTQESIEFESQSSENEEDSAEADNNVMPIPRPGQYPTIPLPNGQSNGPIGELGSPL